MQVQNPQGGDMLVYLATENPGKVHEMKRIFDVRLPGTELKCVADLPRRYSQRILGRRNRYYVF
jgi:inosine/xanthosine triphosphate pyrophosphatase family protein